MRNEINSSEKLKKRFDDGGRSFAKYATAKGLQETALKRVIFGITNGVRSTQEGQTRKVILRLKEDGIWIGRLPWEQPKAKEVA